MPSRHMILADTLSFSGTPEARKSIKLPNVRADELMVVIRWKITTTKVGPTNFQSYVDHMSAGAGAVLPLYAEINELSILADFLQGQTSTGLYNDAAPSSGVEQVSYYKYIGPFNFVNIADPEFVLKMRDITAIDALATAFGATVSVYLLLSPQQTGFGYYADREISSSDTVHKIPLGPSTVADILVQIAHTSYLQQAKLPGDATGTFNAVDCTEGGIPAAEWAERKQVAAVVDGSLYFPAVMVPDFPKRALYLKLGTASQALVWAKNIML